MADTELKIPKHIAVILDGNGRWAKKRGLPRKFGHMEGAKALEQMIFDAAEMGVDYVTVYAFSTENWKRPDDEVEALMDLLRKYLKKFMKIAEKNKVRFVMIGDRSKFAPDIIELIDTTARDTSDYKRMTFVLAINYGGRDEIRRCFAKMAEKVAAGELSPEDISEELISENLDTAGIPDPDLLIRTSGEKRLSNYLIWQCAYTEFYFTDIYWPDFDKNELKKAIEYYSGRTRRFGAVEAK